MDIINKRPADFTYEEYKDYLKMQKKWIKERRKGILFYVASEIFYAPEDTHKLFGLKTTHNPFRGKMREIDRPIIYNN